MALLNGNFSSTLNDIKIKRFTSGIFVMAIVLGLACYLTFHYRRAPQPTRPNEVALSAKMTTADAAKLLKRKTDARLSGSKNMLGSFTINSGTNTATTVQR